MTLFETLSIAMVLITAVGIPFFNYMNNEKRTSIKNDILSTLSSESTRIRDGINRNASDIKALRAELRYMIRTLDDRIDGIESYLQKMNGFIPRGGNSNGERKKL